MALRTVGERRVITSWEARIHAAMFLGWSSPIIVGAAVLAEMVVDGAGPVSAVSLVALLAIRVARQRCVLANGRVVCANILSTRSASASAIRFVRVADPPSLQIFGHGYRSNAWLCLECQGGRRLYPSALIRRHDRTDQEALAAALGLPLTVGT